MSFQDMLTGFIGLNTKTPTTVVTIKPTLSPVQQTAIDTARNVRMGSWLQQSAPMQNLLANMRTTYTTATILKSGGAIVPQNMLTTEQQALNQAMMGQLTIKPAMVSQETAIADYYKRLNEQMQILQASTQKSAVLEAQMQELMRRYQELLNKPPEQGLDWKQLLIYGALAVGGLIALKYILGGKK